MGRYYTTESGRAGKFMFGVQPSNDPELLGMNEQEPTSVWYYADTEDADNIRDAVDAQYEILGIPDDKRIYYVKDEGEYEKFEKEVIDDKVWIKCKIDSEEYKKHDGETKWAGDSNDEVMFERDRKLTLAMARIRLGITILSDIEDDACCELEAEL